MREIFNKTHQNEMEAIFIDCNDCSHCVDLKTPSPSDPPPLTNARNKIKRIIMKWLTPSQEDFYKINGKNISSNLPIELKFFENQSKSVTSNAIE
jgi:hypothetical protein